MEKLLDVIGNPSKIETPRAALAATVQGVRTRMDRDAHMAGSHVDSGWRGETVGR